MKRGFYYLAPLNCIAYVIVLWALAIVYMRSADDMDSKDIIIAVVMLIYAAIITLLSLYTMRIKDKRIWWWTQIVLSVFVIGSVTCCFLL